jgi:hypothetical protein
MRSRRLSVALSGLSLAVSLACGSNQLPHARAAELLAPAIQSTTLSRALPALTYCMSAAKGFTFNGMSQMDFVATFRELKDKTTLYEAVAADVIRIELQEFAFDPSGRRPDSSCDAVHAQAKSAGYTSQHMRLAVVKTKLTKKATDAGLALGNVIDAATRELVEVTSVAPGRDGVVMAKYTWRWKPTKLGEALSLAADPPKEATARFRRFDDGWRVEDLGVPK